MRFQLIKVIYTDAHIYDPDVLAHIMTCLDQIIKFIKYSNIDLSQNELVLDLQQTDGGQFQCGYYLMEDATRSVFWLEKFDASPLLAEVSGAEMPSHISTSHFFNRFFFATLMSLNRTRNRVAILVGVNAQVPYII